MECGLTAAAGPGVSRNLVLTVVRCLLSLSQDQIRVGVGTGDDFSATKKEEEVEEEQEEEEDGDEELDDELVCAVVECGRWRESDVRPAVRLVLRFTVPVGGGVRAYCPTLSLAGQSCLANCRLASPGPAPARLTALAALPVPRGRPLTLARVPVLRDAYTRRRLLRDRFLLKCDCARCLSPSELGSYASALCCLACENILGFFLPPGPASTPGRVYTCCLCGYQESYKHIHQ